MHTAYLFNYVSAPWLTQYWSRKVVQKVYSGVSPQYGYSGDEDQGLMGSLAVLMKMGLFSVKGGCDTDPIYELGSPIFDEITIHLNPDYYPGETFKLIANNNSPDHMYIDRATWQGRMWDKVWIRHEDLVNGGTLILQMSGQPNKSWGVKNLPPSMSD